MDPDRRHRTAEKYMAVRLNFWLQEVVVWSRVGSKIAFKSLPKPFLLVVACMHAWCICMSVSNFFMNVCMYASMYKLQKGMRIYRLVIAYTRMFVGLLFLSNRIPKHIPQDNWHMISIHHWVQRQLPIKNCPTPLVRVLFALYICTCMYWCMSAYYC